MSFRSWDRGSEALGAALTFAVAVTLFTWGGYWLDGRLESSPLFLIVGAALGVVGGFFHLLHQLAPDLMPFGKKPGADRKRKHDGGEDAPHGS